MKLQAEKRTPGRSNDLRAQGRLPALMYNKELNVPVSVDLKAFDKAFRAQGTASLIDLDIDGDVHSVLVKQVQMSKRRRVPEHVDFYAVTANQPVEVSVPLELVGTAVGVRDGGQLDVQRREVRISVLPRLIPAHVELDISKLAIGSSIHVSDVVALLPKEAKVLDDLELALVAVVPPRVSDDSAAGEGGSEPEVIGRSADDEAASDD
ncbi:MAG: 50S ribosomal protein L25 [Trueperaceae bacterium]|nr:50S ribosomal protein L25 [Trueperaceae bacterium]